MKNIKYILLVVVCLVFLDGCAGSSQKQIINPDEAQLKNICELATIQCKYQNVAKSKLEAGKGVIHLFEKDRNYWVEYTGTAKIGIDLDEVKINIDDNKVTVFLPEARVLDVDRDESTYKFYMNSDGLNPNPITVQMQEEAVMSAQEKMANTISSSTNLFDVAQNRAKELISNYIRKLGEINDIEYEIEFI